MLTPLGEAGRMVKSRPWTQEARITILPTLKLLLIQLLRITPSMTLLMSPSKIRTQGSTHGLYIRIANSGDKSSKYRVVGSSLMEQWKYIPNTMMNLFSMAKNIILSVGRELQTHLSIGTISIWTRVTVMTTLLESESSLIRTVIIHIHRARGMISAMLRYCWITPKRLWKTVVVMAMRPLPLNIWTMFASVRFYG